MIITRETYEKIEPVVRRIDAIMNLDGASWEEKYDAIFSAEVSGRFYELVPSFHYSDPDCDEYEDVWAFVHAVRDFMDNVKIV